MSLNPLNLVVSTGGARRNFNILLSPEAEPLQSRFSEYTISSSSRTPRTAATVSGWSIQSPESASSRGGATGIGGIPLRLRHAGQSRSLPPPPLPARRLPPPPMSPPIPTALAEDSPLLFDVDPILASDPTRPPNQHTSLPPPDMKQPDIAISAASAAISTIQCIAGRFRLSQRRPSSLSKTLIQPLLVSQRIKSTPTSSALPVIPFSALLLSSPTTEPDLVSVNVGGTKFVLRYTTLVDGREDYLSSFVSDAVKKGDEYKELTAESEVESDSEDEMESEMGSISRITSPFASPFPFLDSVTSLDPMELKNDIVPESPMDHSFFARANTSEKLTYLTNSPLPHLRARSIVPSICSTPPSGTISDPEKSDARSRTPSLSRGRSVERGVKKGRRAMTIFIDRDPSVYPPIIAYLRNGCLPSSHSFPRCPSSLPIFSAAPDVDPTILSLLAVSPSLLVELLCGLDDLLTESIWLGMDDLSSVVEKERDRVVKIAEWICAGHSLELKRPTDRTEWI